MAANRFLFPALAIVALIALGVALFAPIGEDRVWADSAPAPGEANARVAIAANDAASTENSRDDTSGTPTPWDTKDRMFLSPEVAAQGAKLRMLPADARSVLKVGRQLSYGQWVWHDTDVPAGELVVRVDLRNQVVSAFRGGHEIGTAIILYGAQGHETPTGSFPIKRKVKDYHSRSYDAPMPYSLFITDDGVALHGSDVRYGRATHGCVGLPEEFARKLFEAAEKGNRVDIYRGPDTV